MVSHHIPEWSINLFSIKTVLGVKFWVGANIFCVIRTRFPTFAIIAVLELPLGQLLVLGIEKLSVFIINWRRFKSSSVRTPLPVLDGSVGNLAVWVIVSVVLLVIIIVRRMVQLRLVEVRLVINAHVPLVCS